MTYFNNSSDELCSVVHLSTLSRLYIPVVEGRGTLGELEVQQVDLLQYALGIVEGVTPALCERSQAVPLRADALASCVHARDVVVLQSAGVESCLKFIIYKSSAEQ